MLDLITSLIHNFPKYIWIAWECLLIKAITYLWLIDAFIRGCLKVKKQISIFLFFLEKSWKFFFWRASNPLPETMTGFWISSFSQNSSKKSAFDCARSSTSSPSDPAWINKLFRYHTDKSNWLNRKNIFVAIFVDKSRKYKFFDVGIVSSLVPYLFEIFYKIRLKGNFELPNYKNYYEIRSMMT